MLGQRHGAHQANFFHSITFRRKPALRRKKARVTFGFTLMRLSNGDCPCKYKQVRIVTPIAHDCP